MTDIRELFCGAADATTPLLAEPVLVKRFDGPSALAEFTVRGLAGHLLRAMTSIEGYLDRPEPDSGSGGHEPIPAEAYYAIVAGAGAELHSELHQSIRQRGLEAASGPPGEFAALWTETAQRLRARLAAEPAGRLVQVYADLVLTLDDYLVTRLVELVVHADDLALSLGVARPQLPDDATGLVITTLVEVARRLYGDAAVLTALTRRERDVVQALRVI
jgi:uncharacterized protein (TIGR03083 family)